MKIVLKVFYLLLQFKKRYQNFLISKEVGIDKKSITKVLNIIGLTSDSQYAIIAT